jgi:Tfp pilus assembly protein PilF
MALRKRAANAMEIDRLATQLAKNPRSKAFLPLAEEYCKVGMLEEAVSVLEEGLKHYPAFITAMVILGRAYDQLNQPTKARAVLEGAIKLSPDNLRAHRTLIKIYAAQGLTQQALESCRVILTMHPRDEEALSVQSSLDAQAAGQTNGSTALGGPSSPMPSIVGDSCPAQVTNEARVDAPASKQGALRRSATIARLESWLRSLERQRLDRPIGIIHRSNP